MLFRPRDRACVGPVLTVVAALTIAAIGGCERPSTEDVTTVEAPIIGGRLDTTHRGVVSLLKQVQGGFYPACSGTLLTQNLVLTAHHCVAALNSGDGASVKCGTTEFEELERASSMIVSVEANVGSEGIDPFRVAQVWVPPGSNAVCGRDIALLLLAGAGVPASQATPIEPNLKADLAAEEVFAAIGYGLQDPKDETGETAGHRMGVTDAQVFCEGSACGTELVLEGEFIADSPVCSGDSGGPALDKNGRVSGVTSRGDEQCTVGIYSSVAAWRDFIVEKTFTAATSGHYTPPAWAGDPPTGFDPGVPTAGTSSGGSNGSGTGGGLALAGGPTTPVIGGASAVGGSSGNVSPVIDPLGLSCTGQCPGAYVCWAASGKPPGICVPQCSAQQSTCPTDYSCDTGLGACLRTADLPQPQLKQGGGCSVTRAGTTAPPPAGVWLTLLGLAAMWRSRRAKR
jgi:MYXO-CTERM domain-containing protein